MLNIQLFMHRIFNGHMFTTRAGVEVGWAAIGRQKRHNRVPLKDDQPAY